MRRTRNWKRPMLRGFAWLLCLGAALGSTAGCSSTRDEGWADWAAYTERFMQADGRIIDVTFDQKSTSEGQSYALFFALVAGDRPRFDTILAWTSTNLADGHLGDRLPGWWWGKGDDGSWGIRDRNSAPDGDFWTAYALLEAGRLWKSPVYTDMGTRLLATLAREKVVDSAAGKLVLALPEFEVDGEAGLPIDPSYLVPFQLRYFAAAIPQGPWQAVADAYRGLWPQIFAKGVAPDVVMVMPDGSTHIYPPRAMGSYDAIRVYLWAAMSGADGRAQLPLLSRFAELIRAQGTPPEQVDMATGQPLKAEFSPVCHMAAVLPYLLAIGDKATAESLREKLRAARLRAQVTRSSNYYDESLVLFALGYLDGVYDIDAQGRLLPRWAQKK